MAGNPRIDELRKKVEKDPASRLFAQLAEELRKEGELDDAISVAREGLQKHPNYPSARMTLGRGLLDTGDFKAARVEFEQVLKGAPDNILASRFLAECLEHLGDIPAAIGRYKATLMLAPGDKQVLARLEALSGGAGAGTPAPPPRPVPPAPLPAPTAAPAPAPTPSRPAASVRPPDVAPVPRPPVPPPPVPAPTIPPPPPAVVAPPLPLPPLQFVAPPIPPPAAPPADPPPIPLVAADEEFELERPYEAPTPGTRPEPVAAPPVEFELETPHEAPSAQWTAPPVAAVPPPPPPPPPPPAPPAAAAVLDVDPVVEDQEFETNPPPVERAVTTPTFRTELLAEAAREERGERLAAAPVTSPVPASPAAAAPEPAVEAGAAAQAVASPTLAELYFNQGFVDKAVEVYHEIVQRDPDNEKAAQRLSELKAQAPRDSLEARRRQVEHTIARLEGFLAAVKRG